MRHLSTVRSAVALLGLTAGLASVPASADTIDFEGYADSTIITNQYAGLTFTNAIILTAGISLNEFEAPPHSGVNVLSDNGGPITIDFATPISSFSAYFTYYEPLTLTGFDSTNTEVASVSSAYSINVGCDPGSLPTCLGDPGSSPNELLQMSFLAAITSVTITGDALGGSFAMDDMNYASQASTVPEPAGISLLPMALLVTLRLNTFFRKTK